MTCKSLFVSLDQLRPSLGDLIEIDRTYYSHWVIYVGRGCVVHVSHDEVKEVSVSGKAFVFETQLSKVVEGSLVRVNNKEEMARRRQLTARYPGEVVAIASSCVGMELEYGILGKNCEYYVTLWKYGVGWSDQVDPNHWMESGKEWIKSDTGKLVIGVGVGTVAAGLLLGSLMLSSKKRNKSRRGSH